MKIAAAQIKSFEEDIDANIANHLKMIDLATEQDVHLIVFPEMSLTGYQMELADELSFSENDPRLEVFIAKAKSHQMYIIVGAPIKCNTKLHIGSFIFTPAGRTLVYTKHFLHTGEEKFFFPSFDFNPQFELENEKVMMAICADITHPVHPENASKSKTNLYVASIFYTPKGIAEAYEQLGNYARKYGMHVLMANYCGSSYHFESAGQSACWNKEGHLLKQLNKDEEGLLIAEL